MIREHVGDVGVYRRFLIAFLLRFFPFGGQAPTYVAYLKRQMLLENAYTRLHTPAYPRKAYKRTTGRKARQST